MKFIMLVIVLELYSVEVLFFMIFILLIVIMGISELVLIKFNFLFVGWVLIIWCLLLSNMRVDVMFKFCRLIFEVFVVVFCVNVLGLFFVLVLMVKVWVILVMFFVLIVLIVILLIMVNGEGDLKFLLWWIKFFVIKISLMFFVFFFLLFCDFCVKVFKGEYSNVVLISVVIVVLCVFKFIVWF